MLRQGKHEDVAGCTGVNYVVKVTGDNLIVSRRFSLGQSLMTIPRENVKVLELRTKSVIPPLFFGVLTFLVGGGVWGFLGSWSSPLILAIPPKTPLESWPYLFFSTILFAAYFLMAAYWRLKVGTLMIGLVGDQKPITVRLVSTERARRVLAALKP